ncbi:hypothetical protein [Aeropyrum camini]|uniref:Seryl-tRNA synthetase n=1 Tax=Aeropyrum camini SY1 = JCM 12091 TaxID=1198449 RepID=U3TD67_9CREN|nr:hypothetical protein [Aeropyrum camini]BAN90371.1 seryl-tRNA synthetase [Aeropyrum camini SY1 = JCM 12091]
MEGRREHSPQSLEEALVELEERIRRRLQEALGSSTLHFTIVVKASGDEAGISSLSVEVEAVRPGLEGLQDIVDAIVEEEVRRLEERLKTGGSFKSVGRRRGREEVGGDNA